MTRQKLILTLFLTLLVAVSAYGARMMRGHGIKPPAASEFGPGPRTSAKGLYIATLQKAAGLKPRKMYTLQVAVAGADGLAVPDATIAVDGGMPQHGHGLPTKPRITKNLGDGWYELSVLRFNMGGWWEVKLTITTPAGTDTVTFNLEV